MPRKEKESVEAMVARIDERVEQIHGILPMIHRHERDLDRLKLLGKILLMIVLALLAYKFPVIAEALARALT